MSDAEGLLSVAPATGINTRNRCESPGSVSVVLAAGVPAVVVAAVFIIVLVTFVSRRRMFRLLDQSLDIDFESTGAALDRQMQLQLVRDCECS